ncbi:MAG: translation initiation factor IF-2 [Acidobacteriaceae bacterium]|nr:translation initiation factor IF-2 [Acidobacteriaceae bacterium]
MSKIRVNELARELEVKPGVILELLPELGVHEKKTHSSSLDEEVALELRRRLGAPAQPAAGSVEKAIAPEAAGPKGPAAPPSIPVPAVPQLESQPATAEPAQAVRPAPRPPLREIPTPVQPAPPMAAPASQTPVASATPSTAPAAQPAAPGAPQAAPQEPERPAPTFRPLRPPLGGGTALQPPLAPSSGQPSTPGTAGRNVSIPARPLPPQTAPRVPSVPVTPALPVGPRQPLPPAEPTRIAATPERPARPAPSTPSPARPAAPQAPPPPRMPQVPTHVVAPGTAGTPPAASAVPGAPIPARPAPRPATPGLTPGAPIAPRPAGTRPPLAGQPAARPVVPPRQDILQRLKQQQARPNPAAPGVPRPAAPGRPAPTPGQPVFRGPIRPGQPVMRGPGQPTAPGQPGLRRPGGLRPMHPTSLRPEPATLPTEQQRRHQAKPGSRQGPRKREDREEGNLRERISKRAAVAEPPPIDREITVAEGVTVKELSEKLGVKANLVVKKLVEKKIFATINQTLDVKLAEELAREFGASTNQVSYEEESTQDIELAEEEKDFVRRAPVVTIMGHVDHGKTSLLDAVRQTNVAAREAGGITQHIGAYYIEKNGRKIVFIDTPGHQAFTRMRARGAKVTDIVVLVVSADDGVMPQTLEAIDHARAAKVPIIVAINKIDKPDAQPERVKQQLADRGLLAEDWGGDIVMVPVSAKTGQNLDLMLEMILLVADIQDLKANPNRPAIGTVLEAKLDRGRGPVATMLVRNGTLRVGDFFICGALFSKVRAMFDDRGNPVKEAEPSMPVEVIGLDSLPEVGDSFQAVSDTSKAKQIVIYREAKARDAAMAKGARVATLASLNEQFKEGELKDLNLIIKADVGGTAEVLSDTLQQLSNEKIRVRVLRTGVGAITEDDVLLASASEALIIGFNVRAERNAQATAEQQKVDVRLHSIIYELIDEIQRAMTGLLEPVYKETVQGHAEVRETFKISKVGTVAGCYVSDGVIRRDSQIRVMRDGEVIHTGRIEALKRFKNDASEVKNGLECGISLSNFNHINVGDTFEAFTMERIAPQLPEPVQ